MMKLDLKSEVEEWLKQYFKGKGSYEKIIYEAMEYSLMVGGKRIRPILLLLTYSMYRNDYIEVLPVAAALEMIHTYSLIHDDLPCMDNDDLRRGKPTSHKIYGEAIAVLAGDGLLNEAMNIMFSYCLERGKKELQACAAIAKAAGVSGMIGGQVVDILSENKEISKEILEFMHSKKTGELICCSILSGAILGEAKDEEIVRLREYGYKLGLAFQIKDDILDTIGDSSILGKRIKSDENNQKTTFITTYGLDKCKKLCEDLTMECLNILDSIPRNVEELKIVTKFLLERNF